MSAKIVLVFCAQALFIQLAFSQAINPKFGSILNLGNTVGSAALGSSALGSAALGNSIAGGILGNSVSSSSSTVAGLTGLNVVAGGPLAVTSVSPIGPSGLSVASENVIEGILTVNGQLPFLSAVAFEGALPTSGSGVATCGCGNGQVGISGEGLPSGLVKSLGVPLL